MPIYLLHVYVIVACKIIYLKIGYTNNYIYIFAASIISILIPVGVILLFKKVTFIDFFLHTKKYIKFIEGEEKKQT